MSLAALTFGVTSSAAAQVSERELVIEAGALDVRQPGERARGTGMLSVFARAPWAAGSVQAHGVLTGVRDSIGASQVGVGGDLLLPRIPRARLELGTGATMFGAIGNVRGHNLDAVLRPHVRLARGGVFAGVQHGWARRDTLRFRASVYDVGAWTWYDRVAAQLTLQRAHTTDWRLLEAAGYWLARSARSYHLQDAALALHVDAGAVQLQGTHAWRSGLGATRGESRGYTVGAAWHITSRWSITAAAGRQLADLTRGLPEARVAALALRHRFAGGGTADGVLPVRDRVRDPSAVRGGGEVLEAELVRGAAGAVELVITVRAPEQARVEVAGTFNEWTPVMVPRSGDRFVLRVPLGSGTHRVALRVDGGGWRAPAGLVRVGDGMGGESGLVVVP